MTWPPRATVRQLSIADITFNWPRLTTCISFTPGGPVVAEDIRDLKGWASHDRRGLCRRLVLRCPQREPIQRAHDRADHVGGHLRVKRGGVHPGMSEQNLDQTHLGFLF